MKDERTADTAVIPAHKDKDDDVRCQAASLPSPLVVGYLMKESRAAALRQQGLLKDAPTYGVVFKPINLHRGELDDMDVVLQKATDFLQPGNPDPGFAAALTRVQESQGKHGKMCFVDPLKLIVQVVDRQKLMSRLAATKPAGLVVDIPASQRVQVASWPDAELLQHPVSYISLPCIVKPVLSCGLNEAHQMAIITHQRAFSSIQVPLPACISPYINHGATLHKVFVTGSQVDVAQRASTPDIDMSNPLLPAALEFHTLTTPLASLTERLGRNDPVAPAQPLDMQLVHASAEWLRKELNLTLFGFDVIVSSISGVHSIIDVNHFPSFKEVQSAPAALCKAVMEAYLAGIQDEINPSRLGTT